MLVYGRGTKKSIWRPKNWGVNLGWFWKFKKAPTSFWGLADIFVFEEMKLHTNLGVEGDV